MVIEILFSEITDKAKLYNEDPLEIHSQFTEKIETVPCYHYIGKMYCTERIESVKSKIPSINKCEYKGSLERIANEVFEDAKDETILVQGIIDVFGIDENGEIIVNIDLPAGNNILTIFFADNCTSISFRGVPTSFGNKTRLVITPCLVIAESSAPYIIINLASSSTACR